jgi:ABC-2 type transport system permease protein
MLDVSRLQSMRKILFFIKQTNKQLKKKWATLLLLFLFPLVIVGLLLSIVASLIIPVENEPIRVVLVDEDETRETKLFSTLLEEIASGNQFLKIVSLGKKDAIDLMDANEITVYFSFPAGFTKDLYKGNSVLIPIVGNPSKQTESLVVKEMIESLARVLSTAQATIITINDYARELEIPDDEREELIVKQFMDFTLYTLGKNKLLNEEVLTNSATSTPTHYYGLSGWFTVLTIWLLGFYLLTTREVQTSLEIRMRLLGVTVWQCVVARISVSLMGSAVLGTVAFILLSQFIQYELVALDYFRFSLFSLFYGLLFLIGIALLDVLVPSPKAVLLLQTLFAVVCILSSGAIIPTVYFPMAFEGLLPYFFANESMAWMIDIVLEGRNYADYTKLLIYSFLGLIVLWIATLSKERWSR